MSLKKTGGDPAVLPRFHQISFMHFFKANPRMSISTDVKPPIDFREEPILVVHATLSFRM